MVELTNVQQKYMNGKFENRGLNEKLDKGRDSSNNNNKNKVTYSNEKVKSNSTGHKNSDTKVNNKHDRNLHSSD